MANPKPYFQNNQPQFNELQRVFYICQQCVAVMHTLRGRGTITSPLEVAKQILPVAQKYEFYEIALSVLEVFKSYHAFYTCNEKEYEKYVQLVQSYRHISDAEMLAKECFQRLQLLSINSSGNGKKIHELSLQFLNKLDGYADNVKSNAFIINYGLIKVYKSMSVHNWEAIIEICDKVLQKLKTKRLLGVYPLGCKCPFLKPHFGVLLLHSPTMQQKNTFLRTQNVKFSLPKAKSQQPLSLQ